MPITWKTIAGPQINRTAQTNALKLFAEATNSIGESVGAYGTQVGKKEAKAEDAQLAQVTAALLSGNKVPEGALNSLSSQSLAQVAKVGRTVESQDFTRLMQTEGREMTKQDRINTQAHRAKQLETNAANREVDVAFRQSNQEAKLAHQQQTLALSQGRYGLAQQAAANTQAQYEAGVEKARTQTKVDTIASMLAQDTNLTTPQYNTKLKKLMKDFSVDESQFANISAASSKAATAFNNTAPGKKLVADAKVKTQQAKFLFEQKNKRSPKKNVADVTGAIIKGVDREDSDIGSIDTAELTQSVSVLDSIGIKSNAIINAGVVSASTGGIGESVPSETMVVTAVNEAILRRGLSDSEATAFKAKAAKKYKDTFGSTIKF